MTVKRGSIDLAHGGDSWAGFRFGSWGRAKEWRLYLPSGEALQAGEIAAVRQLQADVCYLRMAFDVHQAKAAGIALAFTSDEAQLLRVALGVLLRELPVQLGRRDFQAVPAGLLRVV